MRGMRGVSLNFSLNAGMFVAMEKYLFKYKNSQALNLFCMMMVVVTFIFHFLFMYISRANDFTFYVKNQHSIRTMIKLILVTFYTFISLHMTKHFLHIPYRRRERTFISLHMTKHFLHIPYRRRERTF